MTSLGQIPPEDTKYLNHGFLSLQNFVIPWCIFTTYSMQDWLIFYLGSPVFIPDKGVWAGATAMHSCLVLPILRITLLLRIIRDIFLQDYSFFCLLFDHSGSVFSALSSSFPSNTAKFLSFLETILLERNSIPLIHNLAEEELHCQFDLYVSDFPSRRNSTCRKSFRKGLRSPRCLAWSGEFDSKQRFQLIANH